MLSAPSTDPQMKFLGKLDALHQKMLPYNQGPSIIKTGQETPDLFTDFRFMLWTPAPPCGKEVTLMMFTFW